MNIGLVSASAGVLLGIALAAALMLATRWFSGPTRWEAEHRATVPVWIRFALAPAMMVEPLVARALPAAHASRTERTLESLGLAPTLTAARWEATRVVLAGGCAAVAACWAGAPGAALAATVAFWSCGRWLTIRSRIQAGRITRELPAYLDLMTVCVEAGATLTAGIRLIVAQSPPGPVCSYFDRVLREVRGGRPRAQAFTHVAELFAAESLETLASALAHAETSGMSLGQVLRAQAEQRTAERFSRAERLAMQAPVKMLGPLILCIFPCTFIVIAVPIAVRLREALGT